MASTVQSPANLAEIVKSTWTSNRLEKQFFNETPWLDRLERLNKYTVGDFALVPLHVGRSGGHTVLGAEGGTLNNPTKQKTKKAQFGLSYNWKQIGIEFGALNQVTGGEHSVADALDLEVTGGIDDLRYDVARQVGMGDGSGAIATTGVSTTTNTINLATVAAGGYGWDAVQKGFLRGDLEIDIGTQGNPTSVANDVTITAVNEGADDGTGATITVSGAAITTAAGNIISLHQSRNADGSSNEMMGLRGLFGTNNAVGGLDPAVYTWWKPAFVDTTSTTLSLDLLLKLQLKVYQKINKWPRDLITSAKQVTNYYSQLENQVRFPGDGSLEAGNVDQTKWKGISPVADPSIADREVYLGDVNDMLLVTGKYQKPTWVSDVEGTNKGLNWIAGTTRFQDAIAYPLGLGTRRRQGWASAVNLTA